MAKSAQPVTDSILLDRLKEIEKHPNITKDDVEAMVDRNQLIDDLCRLIARLAMTEPQALKLYNAVTARYQHKTCYKCLKVKCIIGGYYEHIGGDMSKQKRFVCSTC